MLPGPLRSDPFIWCLGIITDLTAWEGEALLEVPLAKDCRWGPGNVALPKDGEPIQGIE